VVVVLHELNFVTACGEAVDAIDVLKQGQVPIKFSMMSKRASSLLLDIGVMTPVYEDPGTESPYPSCGALWT